MATNLRFGVSAPGCPARRCVGVTARRPCTGCRPRRVGPPAVSSRATTRFCVKARLQEGVEKKAGVVHRLLEQINAIPAEKPLGKVYKFVLPGHLFHLPSLLVPLSTGLGAIGACYVQSWLHHFSKFMFSTDVQVARNLVQYLEGSNAALTGTLLSIICSLAGFLFLFGLLPVGDFVLGPDLEIIPEGQQEGKDDGTYRSILHTFIVLHWGVLLLCCQLAATHDMHPLAILGLLLSLGAEGGILFTVAHELVHSRHPLDRLLPHALLASVGYMHWGCSHLAHHVKVATAEDPASARLGESVYAFLPRSVLGNLQDGFLAEHQRLSAKGLPLLSPHNRMVWWVGTPLALAAAINTVFGPLGLTIFLGQAVAAVVVLEVVNYIEHYGLQRCKTASGRYEKVGVRHSWNANWILSNAVSLNLQFHADHHMHGSRPYQLLRSLPDAPQLPASYPVMTLLALWPQLWFHIMDPRVEDFNRNNAMMSGDNW